MGTIDMHCDTLMQAYVLKRQDLNEMPGMVDFKRMRQGGMLAQFFAVFMLPPMARRFYPDLPEFTDESYFADCAAILEHSLQAHSDVIAPARSAAEIRANRAAGRMSAVLTVEDGRIVEGKLERLETLYRAGVRAIGLTWNGPNCLGFPASREETVMASGLTAFGKDAVRYMQELGILVDVSHLSDGGFFDVAAVCKKPFIASHSNCRAVCPHPRNLTDEMLRTLSDCGGVAGLNFTPEFLNPDGSAQSNSFQAIVAMAQHMKKVAGIEVIGIGSDFDGMEGDLEVKSAGQYPLLADALSSGGFSDDEVDKILSGNVLRVMDDAIR